MLCKPKILKFTSKCLKYVEEIEKRIQRIQKGAQSEQYIFTNQELQ